MTAFNDMTRFHRDRRGLTLVPGYESHDLKHCLLGFEMTAEDEVRMQAFMIGNGNLSAPPIARWSIERYADRGLVELRAGLVDAGGRDGARDA